MPKPEKSVEQFEADQNIIPIQIRKDLTVKIQGIPWDLTSEEANKIKNVVVALVDRNMV